MSGPPRREVVWTEQAMRDMRRLDRRIAERVRTAVGRFAETSYGDVRYLVNITPPTRRLRVGDCRVHFRIEAMPERTLTTMASVPSERLLIQLVLHRHEAYRD